MYVCLCDYGHDREPCKKAELIEMPTDVRLTWAEEL